MQEEVIPAFMQASTLSLDREILETGTCSKLEVPGPPLP